MQEVYLPLDWNQTDAQDPREKTLMGSLKKFFGRYLGPKSPTPALVYLQEEKVSSQPQNVRLPWFLPYEEFDTGTGETPVMRMLYRRALSFPPVKAAVLNKLFGVAALKLQIHPADKHNDRDRENADTVRWNLVRRFRGGMTHLTWQVFAPAMADGYSVNEKIFGQQKTGKYAGKIALTNLKQKDVGWDIVPKTDTFSNITGYLGLRYNGGREFHPADFVHYAHLPMYERPTGMSDYRAAYDAMWLYDTAWKLRRIQLTTKSFPILMGMYEKEAQQPGLNQALRKAKALNFMTVPKGCMVQALDIAGASLDVFRNTIQDLREEIVMAINGAFLTQMAAGENVRRGDPSKHQSVTDLFKWFLSECICGYVLNDEESGLIKEIVDLNHVASEYPYASLDAVSWEEMKQLADIVDKAKEWGLPISEEWAYEKFALEAPHDDVPGGDQLGGNMPGGPGQPPGPGGTPPVGPDGQPLPGGANPGGSPWESVGGQPGGTGGSPIDAEPHKAFSEESFASGQYEESLHPRDDKGLWVDKGDMAAARTDAGKANQLRARVTNPKERAKLEKQIGGGQQQGHSPQQLQTTALNVSQAMDAGQVDKAVDAMMATPPHQREGVAKQLKPEHQKALFDAAVKRKQGQPSQASPTKPPADQPALLSKIGREAQDRDLNDAMRELQGVEIKSRLGDKLPKDVADQFDAHGTGTLKELTGLLNGGIDPKREFYSSPLGQAGAEGGGHGVTVRDNSSFVVLGHPGKTLKEGGIAGVMVDPLHAPNIPDLQKAFPGVKFLSVEDAPATLSKVAGSTRSGINYSEFADKGGWEPAVRMGHRGGLKGGPARARALPPERRHEIAVQGGKARQQGSHAVGIKKHDEQSQPVVTVETPQKKEEMAEGGFDESKHPRDDKGQWVRAAELHAAQKDPVKANALRSRVVNPKERMKLERVLSGHHPMPPPEQRQDAPAAPKPETPAKPQPTAPAKQPQAVGDHGAAVESAVKTVASEMGMDAPVGTVMEKSGLTPEQFKKAVGDLYKAKKINVVPYSGTLDKLPEGAVSDHDLGIQPDRSGVRYYTYLYPATAQQSPQTPGEPGENAASAPSAPGKTQKSGLPPKKAKPSAAKKRLGKPPGGEPKPPSNQPSQQPAPAAPPPEAVAHLKSLRERFAAEVASGGGQEAKDRLAAVDKLLGVAPAPALSPAPAAAPAPTSGHAPGSPEHVSELVNTHGVGGEFAPMHKLRAGLAAAGITGRAAQDAAIKNAYMSGRVHLHNAESSTIPSPEESGAYMPRPGDEEFPVSHLSLRKHSEH